MEVTGVLDDLRVLSRWAWLEVGMMEVRPPCDYESALNRFDLGRPEKDFFSRDGASLSGASRVAVQGQTLREPKFRQYQGHPAS